MTGIPLHNLFGKILGVSIRDLVLDIPEKLEEFKKRVEESTGELKPKEAAAKAWEGKGGGEE